MTSVFHRMAAAADAPVFALAGAGMRWAVQDLLLADGITLVDSPRAASILLVAGELGPRLGEAAARVHDALPHPRATVLWASAPDGLAGAGAERIGPDADPVAATRAVFRDLVLGGRPSEPALLPDVDPATWRGVGPYGQGGSGMTGGTPYGRPMAELGPDRDGLRLDVLPTRLGPFFAPLPAGLELDLRVSGDVVVEARVTGSEVGTSEAAGGSAFVRALTQPQSIADLEMARARAHLRWAAEALRLQGLRAISLRALELARTIAPGDSAAVGRFATAVQRTGVYRWSLPNVDDRRRSLLADARLGPVSRACGGVDDERLADPAYIALGFAPITDVGDGVAAVWRARFGEASQSVDLASRAGSAVTTVTGTTESPRGRIALGDAPTARALEFVPALVEGLEWGDALATIAALDLDLDEMAALAGVTAA